VTKLTTYSFILVLLSAPSYALGLPVDDQGIGSFLLKIVIGIIILIPCYYAFIYLMAANPLDRAIRCFKREKYREAAGLWKKAVATTTGDEFIESQFNLAVCERFGLGVPQNQLAAYELFSELARQQLSDAQYQLGALLLDSNFEKHAPSQAESHLLAAAKQGFLPAQLLLIQHYEQGTFGLVDKQSANYWRSAASEDDNSELSAYQPLLFSYGQGALATTSAKAYIQFSGRHRNKLARVTQDLDDYGC